MRVSGLNSSFSSEKRWDTTDSYYYTANGIAYAAAPDMKVGEGGYNAAPFAYSPSLKRLVFIKQETTNFAPSGVTLSTYDFP